MTLSEKIKLRRKAKGLTQHELCGDKITRNMLSAIESGKATPSLETLRYLADGLSVPVAYLLSAEDDLLFFEKKEAINDIIKDFREKKYNSCILRISRISGLDDELCYILCVCNFELGRRAVLKGSLYTAKDLLAKAKDYSSKTVYDTAGIDNLLLMYSSLAENIQSPLLEFDIKRFEANLDPDFEYEFYKYITGDFSYNFKNPVFQKHRLAKEQMKSRKYKEAIKTLEEIVEEKNPSTYNSYLMFGVYTDLENSAKQLLNFELAYKYASKRLSMLEGFKA